MWSRVVGNSELNDDELGSNKASSPDGNRLGINCSPGTFWNLLESLLFGSSELETLSSCGARKGFGTGEKVKGCIPPMQFDK